jgi:hypothetical protein
MSVGNINSATSSGDPMAALRSALQNVAKPSGAAVAVGAAAPQSAAQELRETPAQTQAEAAKGDMQARRLLTREQAAQSATEPAAETGYKNSLDAVA